MPLLRGRTNNGIDIYKDTQVPLVYHFILIVPFMPKPSSATVDEVSS